MSVLDRPFLYEALQEAIGKRHTRDTLVRRYLRPVAGQRVLDLGCGTGRVLKFLPPVHYWGMDLNAGYIRYAEKRFGDNAHFIRADICQTPWPLQGAFDRVLAIGLFHHLPDEQVLKVMSAAQVLMKPGAVLISLDGCFEPSQSPIARLLLSLDRGKYVRDRGSYEALARSVFKHVRSQVERDFLRIPYSHLVMEMTAG